jgi:hypothetical protein
LTIEFVTCGRVRIEYDLSRPEGMRVVREGITVDGQPLLEATRAAVSGPNTGQDTPEARVRSLLLELYDAVWVLDRTVPMVTLASRDAADKLHEVVVSPIWKQKSDSGENQAAFDFCFWTLRICEGWERAIGGQPRYIHKGTPFYFAATSALKLRNIDLGLMLLERADFTDSETYQRAGMSEKGVVFPGRSTLLFQPNHNNLLYLDVVAGRKILDSWLAEFASTGACPLTPPPALTDLDAILFGDPALITESRYLFGFLVWANWIQSDSVLSEARMTGPLTRRRQAEWWLGLLTATEGLIRTAKSAARAEGNYADVVAGLISRASTVGGRSAKSIRKTLDKISDDHHEDLAKCLDYWAKWSPMGKTTGFPWWVRWIEPGRFLRNQTAHILEAPASLGLRWLEFERTVKFAFFSAVLLHRSRAVQAVGAQGSSPI